MLMTTHDTLFDLAFDRLIGHEGGYVNNPDDPGGETKWGISKRQYPSLNIKALTREEAKVIYRRDFWEPLADGLHNAVMYQVFDAAVNHGIGNSIRMLQRAVGVVDDGHWGPVSKAAYGRLNHNDVLMAFLAERLDFMRRLRAWDAFGRGWAGRVAQNLRYAAADN